VDRVPALVMAMTAMPGFRGKKVACRGGFAQRRLLFCLLALGIVLMATVVSCGSGAGREGRIGVVVSQEPLGNFVKNVAGDMVDVTVLVPPGSSPHTYELTPSQMAAVSEAEMYVKVGSGVEFESIWMGEIVEVNPDMLIVDSSEGVELLGGDPHIWNSPVIAKSMVENICYGLVQADPGNSAVYARNRDDYLKELDVLDGYIRCTLDDFTNRYFITYHPAFTYFANEYSLTQLVVEHGGKEPTPQVLRECVDNAMQHHLEYVFVSPQFVTDDCETIADEIGGQVAAMDPLPENYIANMGRIADALALEFAD